MSRHAVRASVVFVALSAAVLCSPVQAQDPSHSTAPDPLDDGIAGAIALDTAGRDARGQLDLGIRYYSGRGVPQDYVEAVPLFRLAAEQGLAPAQYNLGLMYANGRGAPRDSVEAAVWYRLAAEQGHVEAQYLLGWMYHFGHVGNASPSDLTGPGAVEAVAWYRQAAEQGHAEAQHKLGRMYHQGRGVPQDLTEAVAWYHRAAEQGQPQALWFLGDLYSEGLGVPQDFVEAHRWYNLAASRLTGDQREEAATDRDAVAEQMTPADLSEAQRRAREWHAAHPAP